jgi:hypothetical protein
MVRNKVYAIVEGHGEADPPSADQDPAVTLLMAKLLHYFECWDLFPAKRRPWRLDSCGDFYTDTVLNALRAHKEFPDCATVLVIFDLDDGASCIIGPSLVARVRGMEDLPFSVVVVCARREYEAWFLASLETVQPGHTYPSDPEAIRGAKEWLTREFGYREVRDQARYTQAIDVARAGERSRSFRRLYHAFEELIAAAHTGQPVITPFQKSASTG